MRVKFLEGVAGVAMTFWPGDETRLPDDLAKRYIAQGTCVEVKAKRGAKRETATRSQRELAVGG